MSQSLIECLKESLSKFSDGNQMIMKIGLRSGDHDIGGVIEIGRGHELTMENVSCMFVYCVYSG